MLHPTTSFTLALLLTLLPALTWDFSRNQPSSFFEQSLINYGGLTLDLAGFSQRGWGFVNLLFYSSGSYSLNLIFLIGCPLLLLYDVYCFGRLKQNGATLTPPQQQTQDPIMAQIKADCLLALFCLGFFMLHAVLSFQVWDRYMLGLMPFLALLLARVLLWPCSILKHQIDHPHPKLAFLARTGGSRVSKLHRKSNLPHLLTLIMTLALIWLLTTTLAGPIRNAINARYPLGSNSRALQGIEQITAYLQGHVGANNTLYHHWLGTHWRFYLWAYPYDLQYWESPTELAAKAKAGQYIAHPTHQSDTELRLALFETGLTLHEVTRSYSPNGVPSIILYQIELR